MMPDFISLDWGTSSFRSHLVTRQGNILATITSQDGVLSVTDQQFDQALEKNISAWPKNLPIIASGMITSHQGWCELPYLPCPASLSDLARALVKFTSKTKRTIYFIPGLSCRHKDNSPDVMRGEETQIFGLNDLEEQCCITPGTHSKWVKLSNQTITHFTTYMTGEIFALLKNHSLLGRMMPQTLPGSSDAAFTSGVQLSLRDPAGLLSSLFSGRTLPLFDELAPDKIASYLSGLLIGSEIAHALRHNAAATSYTILASATLSDLYHQALKIAGLTSIIGPENVVVSGQAKIAHTAGLLWSPAKL